MNKIEKLVAELCPDGVDAYNLENVCFFKRGKSITKKNTRKGDIPVISGSVKPSYYHDTSNREGETLAVASSGTAGFVSYWDQPVYLSDSFSIHPDEQILRTKYVFYFLKSRQDDIYQKRTGGGVPHIYPKDLATFKISTPPLKIQEEIVEILNTFTRLEAELEAELEARKKQYNYYRDALLDFKKMGGGRIATVSEICTLKRGQVISKKYLSNHKGEFPVYSSQTSNKGVFGKIDSYEFDYESITWTTDGANAGSVFYHLNEKFSITNVCGLLRVIDSRMVSTKYVFYILSHRAKRYVNQGMGNPKLMINDMAQIKIPIPSIKKQNHIVSILDKFSTLAEDISIGLPAEQKARRKQYEYHRCKLLKFRILGGGNSN